MYFVVKYLSSRIRVFEVFPNFDKHFTLLIRLILPHQAQGMGGLKLGKATPTIYGFFLFDKHFSNNLIEDISSVLPVNQTSKVLLGEVLLIVKTSFEIVFICQALIASIPSSYCSLIVRWKVICETAIVTPEKNI